MIESHFACAFVIYAFDDNTAYRYWQQLQYKQERHKVGF